MSRATQRVEVAAQNMANATTPGYKARQDFSQFVTPEQGTPSAPRNAMGVDFTLGKLRTTENPLDLAISGGGFFVVRSADGEFYTRNGQFKRDADGRLVTPEGMALQSSEGDLTLSSASVSILADGTVVDGETPVGRLSIVDFRDVHALRAVGAGLFTAPDGEAVDVANPQVRQGMLETSNVSTATEMLSVMAGLRSAESGARVVQIYDDLMARALTSFGQ
jgi:flagellar basal-body rod protein FlgF